MLSAPAVNSQQACMSRMVRITGGEMFSTFYCCIPSRTQTAYRVIRFLRFPLHILGMKQNAVFAFRFCRTPDDKSDFAFAMMPRSVCIAPSCFKSAAVLPSGSPHLFLGDRTYQVSSGFFWHSQFPSHIHILPRQSVVSRDEAWSKRQISTSFGLCPFSLSINALNSVLDNGSGFILFRNFLPFQMVWLI